MLWKKGVIVQDFLIYCLGSVSQWVGQFTELFLRAGPLHDWLCNIVTPICSASPVFSRRPYFYCTRSLGFSHRYIYFFIWPITSWSIMNWGNHLYVPCQYLNYWTFSFANISNVGLNCSVICIIKPWHRCKVWSLSCHQVLVMNHQSLR